VYDEVDLVLQHEFQVLPGHAFGDGLHESLQLHNVTVDQLGKDLQLAYWLNLPAPEEVLENREHECWHCGLQFLDKVLVLVLLLALLQQCFLVFYQRIHPHFYLQVFQREILTDALCHLTRLGIGRTQDQNEEWRSCGHLCQVEVVVKQILRDSRLSAHEVVHEVVVADGVVVGKLRGVQLDLGRFLADDQVFLDLLVHRELLVFVPVFAFLLLFFEFEV